MDEPEPTAARQRPVPPLAAAGAGGYLLGDALFDSKGAARGLLAARDPAGGAAEEAGHGGWATATTAPRGCGRSTCWNRRRPATCPPPAARPFARELYAMRSDIERRLGNLCCFGGGLAPLPAWVRTPHRDARWVAAKLVINGRRQCRLQGLTA